MCAAPTHVRFTPESDRKSGHWPGLKMKLFGAYRQNKFDFLSIGSMVASANCGKSTLSRRNELFCSKKFNRCCKWPQLSERGDFRGLFPTNYFRFSRTHPCAKLRQLLTLILRLLASGGSL